MKRNKTLAVFTPLEVALALHAKYPERMKEVVGVKEDFYLQMNRDGLVIKR